MPNMLSVMPRLSNADCSTIVTVCNLYHPEQKFRMWNIALADYDEVVRLLEMGCISAALHPWAQRINEVLNRVTGSHTDWGRCSDGQTASTYRHALGMRSACGFPHKVS